MSSRATLCKLKTEGWFKRNGDYTLEQIDAEIARLKRLQLSYQALQALVVPSDPTKPPAFPIAGATEPELALDKSDLALTGAFTEIYNAQAALNLQNDIVSRKATKQDQDAYKLTDPYKNAVAALTKANSDLDAQLTASRKTSAEWTKYNLATGASQYKIK
jgi:hypothetical protein